MRVIAGTARGRKLTCPSGDQTRPTTDRIKETLFNMLQRDIPGGRFLDLFSGSGGIGIEALSRGAEEAVFVEKGREALSCIRQNIQSTGFQERARVMPMDVMSALRDLQEKRVPFQVVFLDPPYDKGWEDRVLPALADSCLVEEGTLVVLEASLARGRELSRDKRWPGAANMELARCKEYKTNCHLFYRMLPEEDGK